MSGTKRQVTRGRTKHHQKFRLGRWTFNVQRWMFGAKRRASLHEIDVIELERTAFEKVEVGDGGAQVDLGLELGHACSQQGILFLEHIKAGHQAGVELGLLQLVLFLAERGGLGRGAHAFDPGLHGADRRANLDREILVFLFKGSFLAVLAGEGLMIERPVGAQAQGESEVTPACQEWPWSSRTWFKAPL